MDQQAKARRYGLDVPMKERMEALAEGKATSLAEAAFHEFRTKYIANKVLTAGSTLDPDHYAISAFAAAWDQCLEAIVALADTPDGAEEVWRLWSQGMLAQGRHVAPERLSWATLSNQDHALDQTIAQGMGVFLANLLKRNPTR